MEQKLWQAVRDLETLIPDFVSVTYGAGGSTRERTHNTVRRLVQETGLVPAAHLTCVNASRTEVDDVARAYWQAGVRHIVALRGDPPQGMAKYSPHPEGYHYASQLVEGLRKVADFEVSVAAFPEKHPESASFDADMDYLKHKIDAGATRAITQYFFDTDHYFRLLDRAQKCGIRIPIVPGIMPIVNFAQAEKFSAMCGAHVPDWLKQRFDGLKPDSKEHFDIALDVAATQCRRLLESGVPHLHFYTLNRAELAKAVLSSL
ncbi:MAG: methylenetetrahydrofolate reductase [NAD(P)H] [Alphaproteobacteria bacterium]